MVTHVPISPNFSSPEGEGFQPSPMETLIHVQGPRLANLSSINPLRARVAPQARAYPGRSGLMFKWVVIPRIFERRKGRIDIEVVETRTRALLHLELHDLGPLSDH